MDNIQLFDDVVRRARELYLSGRGPSLELPFAELKRMTVQLSQACDCAEEDEGWKCDKAMLDTGLAMVCHSVLMVMGIECRQAGKHG